MSHARKIIRSIVPASARAALKAAYRDRVFRRAMKKFLKDPEGSIAPGSRVVANLIYGWGNEDWSALDEYLIGCVRQAMNGEGPILECGSGLSTILVGAVAKSRGVKHWALEHELEWAKKVQHCLDDYRIDSVTLCARPLKDFGQFAWYDAPREAMPESFGFVICDGPPGVTKGGRYGLAPVMNGRLRPGCTIFLDDAAREEEQEIARMWEGELNASSEMIGDAKPYLRMTVGSRN